MWQTKAQQNNIELQMQALAVRNAQAKAQEYALGASASVDLVDKSADKNSVVTVTTVQPKPAKQQHDRL